MPWIFTQKCIYFFHIGWAAWEMPVRNTLIAAWKKSKKNVYKERWKSLHIKKKKTKIWRDDDIISLNTKKKIKIQVIHNFTTIWRNIWESSWNSWNSETGETACDYKINLPAIESSKTYFSSGRPLSLIPDMDSNHCNYELNSIPLTWKQPTYLSQTNEILVLRLSKIRS